MAGGCVWASTPARPLSALKDHDCYDPADPHPSLWGLPGHTNFWAYPGTTYYLQVAEEQPGTTGGEFDLTLEPFAEPEPNLGYPDPCTDDRFDVGLPRVRPSTTWYLNTRSIPSHLSKRDVVGALKRAINTLKGSGNNCGLPDRVDIRHSYGGKTRGSASMCRGKVDDQSVVQFTREISTSGRNCTSLSSGRKYASDSDIWLDSKGLTTDPLVNRCDDGGTEAIHDLEGVILHELMHAAGVDHVPGPGSLLTMNEGQANCSSTQRTLGLGDVLALRRLY